MLFNEIERKVLTVCGCDRRDLTIKRLAYAATYMVAPENKSILCHMRDKLVEEWSDAHYGLYYRI